MLKSKAEACVFSVVFIISSNVAVVSVCTSEAWLSGRGDACYLELLERLGKSRKNPFLHAWKLAWLYPAASVGLEVVQGCLGPAQRLWGALVLGDGCVCWEQLQRHVVPVHPPLPGAVAVPVS